MSRIKSFSVGNGDMFYIEHNSDNFTTIDCCYENEESRDSNFKEIKEISSGKGITRFISTHPDEDHIKGIVDFCKMVGITNFMLLKMRQQNLKRQITLKSIVNYEMIQIKLFMCIRVVVGVG